MPGVARSAGIDEVYSPHGTGDDCDDETLQATAAGSTDVFANGTGVVTFGDAMTEHPNAGTCDVHSSLLDAGSSTVLVNGKGVGRLGDTYGTVHVISTGSLNVIAGG
tara:strand:- start:4708 stop:5028 length:321 start_codon:yes stop_codon:yes gene_type:complete